MAYCNTAVTPLLTHWSYYSLALMHRCKAMFQPWLILRFDIFGMIQRHLNCDFPSVWMKANFMDSKRPFLRLSHLSIISLSYLIPISISLRNAMLKHIWFMSRRICLTHSPGQDSRHFADDIFTWIFMNEKFFLCLKFHWNVFLRVHLTTTQQLFR